ncbi:MAG: hypothetical protein GX604_09125 [Actinobacteria bacterium]|nr:hypothetical protein [Actinomycetota bacterium]
MTLFPCGIRGMGFCLPDKKLEVAQLARAAGVPDIVAQFAGARTVRCAGPNDTPTSLALRAATMALDQAAVDPADVDLCIWCGAAVPDYLMPTSAGILQEGLGCGHAQAFDVAQGCSALLTGLQVAHGCMALDSGCRTALLAGGDTWGAFTLHHNADSVFFGDGGGAVVIQSGHPRLQPVAYHSLTRGRYHDIWMLQGGGARHPASPDTLAQGRHIYRCTDPQTAHGAFKEIYVPTLVQVARDALAKAGLEPSDVAFFSMVNANLRVLELVCAGLDIPVEMSSADYLQEFGHLGSPDVFFNLNRALSEGRIGPGDRVLLLTTGIGFFWVAAIIRC